MHPPRRASFCHAAQFKIYARIFPRPSRKILQPARLYIVVYHAIIHRVLLQAAAFSLDADKLHPLRTRLEASLARRIDADRVALLDRRLLAVYKERTAAPFSTK